MVFFIQEFNIHDLSFLKSGAALFDVWVSYSIPALLKRTYINSVHSTQKLHQDIL